MLFKELSISFPWYEKIEQQARHGENLQAVCDYKLVSPANAFLPFQFYKSTIGGVMPRLWEVYEANTRVRVADISMQINTGLHRVVREGREYFTYFGEALPGLQLAPGFYYGQITFPDGSFAFSEMFFVPEKWFNIADDDTIDYLKFTWYNKGDLRPIFYNDLDGQGIPKFKNVLYLDSFIHASEPEITEDGARDGNDELIVTFQKVTIPYRITTAVPDYLKKALFLMPLHDVIKLVTHQGVRSGNLESVKINSALEANGAMSIVDIIIIQDLAVVKKGCLDNML